MTVVGEAEIDVQGRTTGFVSDLQQSLNRHAAAAGDRFGTLFGRAIGAPLGVLARRAGVEAGDAADDAAAAAGRRFGAVMGRGIGNTLHAPFASAGRGAGNAFAGAFRGVLSGAAVVSAIRGVAHQVEAGFAEAAAGASGLAQLNAALESTHGAVGRTAPELQRLAEIIQNYAGVDDDAVVHAEGLLLTFSRVRDIVGANNDVFSQATRLTADLSRRGFGTLDSAAVQLGKALNDPLVGVTALSRAGIQFDAGQKRTIETLIRNNDLLGAQKIILAGVTEQVGGSAEAFGKTFPGALAITKERFANLRGEIVERFIPNLLDGLGVTNGFMADLEAHPEKIDRIIRAVGGVIRDFALGIRDLFSNASEAIGFFSDHVDRVRGAVGLFGSEIGSDGALQTGLGSLGIIIGEVIGVLFLAADGFLTFTAAVGKNLGQALIWIAGFVRGAVDSFGKVTRAAEIVAYATGNIIVARGLSKARQTLDDTLGDMADDLDHFGKIMYEGGVRLGDALNNGIKRGLLAQAESDPELKKALDILTGGPAGVGISPEELDKYADGVRLRDSFFAGINSPTGSAADASGLFDDTDKLLSEAQKKAADRARELGNAVTQGMRAQVAIVKREISALDKERSKILDFRASVLTAAGAFTSMTDLLADQSTASVSRIQASLNNRLLGLQTFAENLAKLAKRGLDKGVIAELAKAGPENRALASALVTGTDAQIRQLNATEKAIRQQDQVVAKVAVDAAFGARPAQVDKRLAQLNAQLATLNKQIAAQPALIGKAVEAARKKATVATKTSSRTAVPR